MTNMRKLANKISAVCARCRVSYKKRADRVLSPDYCGIECRKLAVAEKIKARTKQCAFCINNFTPRVYQLALGQGKYCSIKCSTNATLPTRTSSESRKKSVATYRANGHDKNRPRGKDHPQFLGEKRRGGYIAVWVDGRGYVQKHRLIMEQSVGRELTNAEIVHHINRDIDDNRLENLELTNRSLHAIEHEEERMAARLAVKRSRGPKLTANTVKAIKQRLVDGDERSALASFYGVSETMISYIKSGKSWSHVAA